VDLENGDEIFPAMLEAIHGARLGQATRVGLGTWLGIVFGVALKLMLAFAMIGLFAWSWLH
jgi:uncharacterized protein YqgC (DUF456 family)